MKTCNKEKYKIAYVCHKGDTFGGFVSHVEHSIYGLKKRGHDVDFFFLGYCDDNTKHINSKIKELETSGLTIEKRHFDKLDKGIGTGLYNNISIGWLVPATPYKTLQQKKAFKEKLETYDAVFWHTPFWFKQKPILQDTDWPMLLDLQNPVNIALHHDANIRSNSAWMYHIDKYFDRIINVHQASYNSCSVLSTPRTLIFNPQIINKIEKPVNLMRKACFFSCQQWKGSKHVDDLIKAVPHVIRNSKNTRFILSGNGIERHYMNATEKCPEEYIVSKKVDPDCDENDIGKKIIDLANEVGGERFKDLNWISEQERDEIYNSVDFLVDTAWYSVNKELGEHFSRTLVEAMVRGVVPIARNLGLSNNEEGIGELFKPNENYIMIPYDATPKQFADILLKASRMPVDEYLQIRENNFKLLKHFDIDYVTEQYEKVIKGEPCGFYGRYDIGGEVSDKFMEKANKQWFGTGDKRTFMFKKEGINEAISH